MDRALFEARAYFIQNKLYESHVAAEMSNRSKISKSDKKVVKLTFFRVFGRH